MRPLGATENKDGSYPRWSKWGWEGMVIKADRVFLLWANR